MQRKDFQRFNVFVILGWRNKWVGVVSSYRWVVLLNHAKVWIFECHSIFTWNDSKVSVNSWVTSDWQIVLPKAMDLVMHWWKMIILWESLQQMKVTWNLPLSPFSLFIRRVGLVDIENIASLEEGALPYNLAEIQRQVQNMKTCWCVWFPLPHWQLFFASVHSLGLDVTMQITKIYNIIKDNDISCSRVINPPDQSICLILAWIRQLIHWDITCKCKKNKLQETQIQVSFAPKMPVGQHWSFSKVHTKVQVLSK